MPDIIFMQPIALILCPNFASISRIKNNCIFDPRFFDEALVNSFEYVTTETEQVQPEPIETQTVARPPAPVADPAPQISIEEQVPAVHIGNDQALQAVSIPQISYELSYSCLLIPRFSDHYLTGDIVEDLSLWVKQVCVSYGWRLMDVMIRPGYLQWIMTVPLTANPAQFIRIARRQTSQKIMENYPRYKRQNLSDDFWAPGFFVAPGAQFQSIEIVNGFILQTRRNQGIS
jgi:REP element-mobilizing transposase RayT